MSLYCNDGDAIRNGLSTLLSCHAGSRLDVSNTCLVRELFISSVSTLSLERRDIL